MDKYDERIANMRAAWARAEAAIRRREDRHDRIARRNDNAQLIALLLALAWLALLAVNCGSVTTNDGGSNAERTGQVVDSGDEVRTSIDGPSNEDVSRTMGDGANDASGGDVTSGDVGSTVGDAGPSCLPTPTPKVCHQCLNAPLCPDRRYGLYLCCCDVAGMVSCCDLTYCSGPSS